MNTAVKPECINVSIQTVEKIPTQVFLLQFVKRESFEQVSFSTCTQRDFHLRVLAHCRAALLIRVFASSQGVTASIPETTAAFRFCNTSSCHSGTASSAEASRHSDSHNASIACSRSARGRLTSSAVCIEGLHGRRKRLHVSKLHTLGVAKTPVLLRTESSVALPGS